MMIRAHNVRKKLEAQSERHPPSPDAARITEAYKLGANS